MHTPSAFIGSWQLKRHSQFVGEPQGRLIYHPDGSMAVVIQGEILKEETRTSQSIAYAGTFSVEGDYVIHHVAVPDLPNRSKAQKRYATFSGDTLTLSETNNPSAGIAVVWERLVISAEPKA